MLIECNAADILFTLEVSGVNANFLRPSLVAAGLDPENPKLWKDMWSAVSMTWCRPASTARG